MLSFFLAGQTVLLVLGGDMDLEQGGIFNLVVSVALPVTLVIRTLEHLDIGFKSTTAPSMILEWRRHHCCIKQFYLKLCL